MKMLSVRLKGSFSLSHLTTCSTNIKTHTHSQRHACTHIHTHTEVVYTGRTIPSDVWMTANPLNNTKNTISVPFLTAAEKTERTDVKGERWGEVNRAIHPKICDAILFVPLSFLFFFFSFFHWRCNVRFSGGLVLNESTSVQFLSVSL